MSQSVVTGIDLMRLSCKIRLLQNIDIDDNIPLVVFV